MVPLSEWTVFSSASIQIPTHSQLCCAYTSQSLVTMERLRQTFRPHHLRGEDLIDPYHVHDYLSHIPFIHGIGIQCEDSNECILNSWHVITPTAMTRHLDWKNSKRPQFVSFYDNLQAATRDEKGASITNLSPCRGSRSNFCRDCTCAFTA